MRDILYNVSESMDSMRRSWRDGEFAYVRSLKDLSLPTAATSLSLMRAVESTPKYRLDIYQRVSDLDMSCQSVLCWYINSPSLRAFAAAIEFSCLGIR